MSIKKSLVTAISIHKETDDILNRLQEKLHKSRSELIREMINFYSNELSKPVVSPPQASITNNSSDVLKKFFELIDEKNANWPTIILSFSIITRGEQVLISIKRKNDSLIRNLDWSFPYIVANSLNIQSETLSHAQKDIGLKLTSDTLLDAQFVPDKTLKKVPVIALYFTFKANKSLLAKSLKYSQLKWIRKSDIFEYSTTSLPQRVVTFLNS